MKTKEKEVPKKRAYIFKHKEYLLEQAHKLYMLKPNEEIIYNTLYDIYLTAVDEGYQRRIEDSRYFKDKQEARRKASWDTVITTIEDIIHKPKEV